MVEKICVCPECTRVDRLIEPSPAICFRANELIKNNECSWKEAIKQAVEEAEGGDEV